MSKFKLRKDVTVGALAAENDKLLEKVFLDLGYLKRLLDTSDPGFIVLGRTGSGKTALLGQLQKKADHSSSLDPEELSMQYLHNSTILPKLKSWGVNLEIFYKFLWRHVCILELVRMRYHGEDPPSILRQVLSKAIGRGGETRTQKASLEYLEKYAGNYWIKSDTNIKSIVEEVEQKLKKDSKIAANLSAKDTASIETGISRESESSSKRQVASEVIERAQAIVSDFLIADLKQLIDDLSKHGFNDPQKRYYLVIDDLDKGWMPDDSVLSAGTRETAILGG